MASSLPQVVDTSNPTAIFIKGGKPWYLSPCPNYAGYWLDGHIGSVQCEAAGQLLPGHFWYAYCKEKCIDCPYCNAK